MSLSLSEINTISELAKHFYDYLPGTPFPYSNKKDISFPGVARENDLQMFWIGGSKLPAITELLKKTLEYRKEKFCDLIVSIVQATMQYSNRSPKFDRDNLTELNKILLKLKFKIPDLWDGVFIESLPKGSKNNGQESDRKNITYSNELKNDLIKLSTLEPKPRGFAFEKFLNTLFQIADLNPRASFRNIGEQIDGSFELDRQTYLLEAKWQNEPIGRAELAVFRDKVETKTTWARGLFISYNIFSPDGLEAFAKGKATSIIGMTGQDLHFILDDNINIADAIRAKTRWASETGEFYKSIYELLHVI